MKISKIPDRRILDLTGQDFKWGGYDVTPDPKNLVLAATAVHFRGLNDDGNEAGATFYADQDTNYEVSPAVIFQHRQALDSNGGSGGLTFKWQYSHNGGSFTDVSDTSPIQWVGSANITDGEATTKRVSVNASWVAGSMKDAGGTHAEISMTSIGTEVGIMLRIDDAQTAKGDTFAMRVIDTGGLTITQTTIGTITVGGSAVTSGPPIARGASFLLLKQR